MGTFKSIGDKEHLEIMGLYAPGLGYDKIHQKLNRSTKALHDHIHKHNDAVNRSGFCVVCRRAGGEYAGEVVKRGKAK
jgi:predicted nucleic acid-binding Zn finger protein